MKTLGASTVLLLWFVLLGLPSGDRASGTAPTVPLQELGVAALADTTDPTGVVRRYCVRCHNERLLRGNLTLEEFDVETAHERAPTAEKMIRKLRAGMMPPPGQRRPAPATLRALVESLETVVDREAARDRNPGSRRFQRLNRAEYERVIRDLLDLEIDAGRWLPADTYLGAFDNMSDAQGLSTTLLEAYLRAATEVSRLAVGNPDARSKTAKYTNPIDVSQHAWDHIEGTPYGTRGGMVVTHSFPVDGEYVFSIETLFGQGTGFRDIDISIDGEGVAPLGLEHGGRSTVPIRTEPIFVRAGQRQVAAAFVRMIEGPYEDRLKTPGWSFVGGEDSQAWANYGITALPHLSELMITGPRRSTGLSETASRRKIFRCHPGRSAAAATEDPGRARACAESIVTRLAREAYRRPVTEEDLAGPMSFYDQEEEEGFEIGVRTALQAILAGPSFIFRLEQAPPEVAPGESYRIADVDLASRLSFFLWAASPDDELLTLAAEERLSDPGVLELQVRRMLADPRAEALSTRFASQWLRLQDADDNEPEPYLYPDFTGQLRGDLVRETQTPLRSPCSRGPESSRTLHGGLHVPERAPRGTLRDCGVSGPDFRRVTYPDDSRRGVLGHGSVLLLTSMSARTSPVLRGKW